MSYRSQVFMRSGKHNPIRRNAFLIAVLLCGGPLANGQELEPLAYAPNPTGVDFLVTAYSNTWGDILFDTSSPLSDVTARWNSFTLAYGHTFGLFGRSANFALAAPVVWGTATGKLNGEPGETSRQGFADPRLRIGINLLGAPALSMSEFIKAKPRTTLGATVVVAPPLGEYLPEKLINLGANRWSVKTELGLSHPVAKWRFEAAAGIWWFSDNDDFVDGSMKEQEPVVAYQLHAIYSFRPQFWIAADATWYRGGTTTINDEQQLNFQSNTRFGLTGSYPLTRHQSIKLAYNKGVTTRSGGAFKQVLVAWQYTWY